MVCVLSQTHHRSAHNEFARLLGIAAALGYNLIDHSTHSNPHILGFSDQSAGNRTYSLDEGHAFEHGFRNGNSSRYVIYDAAHIHRQTAGGDFVVPWATPAPIGIFISTGFQLIALLFVAVLLIVDAVIYMPFLKAYDKMLCDEETERAGELGSEVNGSATVDAPAIAEIVAPAPATSVVPKTATAAPTARLKESVDGLKVLVLCAGAGTSAMLANAIKEGAAATGENIASAAGAYGQHTGIMSQYDVIVLAPQVRSYYEDMKADTDRLGIKLLAPRGQEYIQLTRDPEGAIKWLRQNMAE